MLERHILDVLSDRLRDYPAVALLGARQTGKTTLARTISPVYYDLELEPERLRLDLQWDDVSRQARPVVLDEAQNFPDIFPRLRNAIDGDRKRNGRFLILGSVSPGLMKQVSEFLTGRIALIELCPLSIEEVESISLDELWLMGGFPDGGILHQKRFPGWQSNYLEALAMRDLPTWGLPGKPAMTQRFFKMLAAANGGPWNASQIGKSMGLSYHTVNNYLDYLEQTFLIRRLQPYSTNLKKRLVKSPKVYWRDSGLLHCLLNIARYEDLLAQPWVGISWEGWVIEQILIALNNRGVGHEAFFFRTSDGHEADLVLQFGRETWVIEIKLAATIGRRDIQRLQRVAEMIKATKGILLSRAAQEIKGRDICAATVAGVLELLPKKDRLQAARFPSPKPS
jgi:predicted AAA+ superfamily ATPase